MSSFIDRVNKYAIWQCKDRRPFFQKSRVQEIRATSFVDVKIVKDIFDVLYGKGNQF